MKTVAAIFDVFGTLIEIRERRSPYLRLLKHGRLQGRRPRPDDALQLLTRDFTLRQAADHFDITIDALTLRELEQVLEEELAGLKLFPDALEAIALLQDAGVKTAVCSNLAAPYGPSVRRLLPGLSAYGFSYSVGAAKPDPNIYNATCSMLCIDLGQQRAGERVVMIGDSLQCDRDGPAHVGITGFHLNRRGDEGITNLVDFAKRVVVSAKYDSAWGGRGQFGA